MSSPSLAYLDRLYTTFLLNSLNQDTPYCTAHTSTHSTASFHIVELRDHLQQLDPPQETVVYCRVGLRGYLAARILLQHGFTHVFNLTGG
ncbi:rhodanese-like domain-containing protein, partial [Nitrospira sp. T9]|uniref:rhodanese-like domain-containing protein n=1 Tax=unclassified Nitrospira TaxID=2652172 RepID=UPI003F970B86